MQVEKTSMAMATPGLPRPRVRFKGGSEMSAADSVTWRTFHTVRPMGEIYYIIYVYIYYL